jgi:hypothetical protein
MCNCWSVGLDLESFAETKKDRPELLFPWDYFPKETFTKSVAVDKCIAHVIKHLWKNGVWTDNSCCGHNGAFCGKGPSIVFEHFPSKKEGEKIHKLIKEADDRVFVLQAWKLTKF